MQLNLFTRMGLKHHINRILRKFDFEIHGLSYLRALSKGEFKSDVFSIYNSVYTDNHKLTIIDAGANRGVTIDQFKKEFPSSEIHAFEPFPDLVDILKQKYSSAESIFINELALTDKCHHTLRFYVNHSADTNSLLASKKTGLNSDASVQIRAEIMVSGKTLDEYAEQNKLTHIHILKLDIQGGELMALRGAEQLLRNKKIDFIFTESYFIQQYQKQPLFHEIVSYLFNYGYTLQDIYNPIYGHGKLAWCDALFVSNIIKLN